ncbi:MAG: GH92 family glycosyl hydrolase [Bacteroidales bacterium]|nr:GH92 family glycosyl hydrolase [Bacteroidales bacterium]
MRSFFRRIICIAAALTALSLTGSAALPDSQSPVDYVNTLVGTLSTHSFSTGNTYPAVARPWGMNFWTPQTGRNGDGWQYVYTAGQIRGLKQTHQPSPWMNDYGEFSIMPVTTGAIFDENERASWFGHKAETATPYYYGVYLADHDTYAELTPTSRAAAFRFTYPERERSYLVVDAYEHGSYVKIIPERNTIVGYTTRNVGGVGDDFHNWFIIQSDTPFEYCGTVSDGKLSEAAESKCEHALALVGFKTSRGQKVNFKVASSFISLEQAELNLRELGDGDFDRIKEEGRAEWNERLGRIEVKDEDIDHLRTFYSCLYRSLLFPRDLSEIDAKGRRVHYSPYDSKVHDGYLYGDTGFWDTFRSLFALVYLFYPEEGEKMMQGWVNVYKESGLLPEWSSPGHRGCMIGNNSASVVTEAWMKGIRGYDVETLWEAVTHGAHAVHPNVKSTGRYGWEWYDRLGYVPCDVGINESAARTLEYAYDDWCIWRLGTALGKPAAQTDPYLKSCRNYQYLYRSADGLMGGRRKDGSFPEEFNKYKWGGDFTEGNSLHYTWSVFHDIAGLMKLMGGKQKFADALDNIFNEPPIFDESYYRSVIHEIREMQVMNMGNYAHGNQPIQHVLYLYDWCGQPWKTQEKVRKVMETFYSDKIDGYCGDEDNGQTSAWYVFSALGFYPVCPASAEYAIGTPLFRKATVHFPSGKDLVITSDASSPEAFYVKGLKFGDKAHIVNFFTHEQLIGGGQIEFKMSEEPNTKRGIRSTDAPYSLTNNK